MSGTGWCAYPSKPHPSPVGLSFELHDFLLRDTPASLPARKVTVMAKERHQWICLIRHRQLLDGRPEAQPGQLILQVGVLPESQLLSSG